MDQRTEELCVDGFAAAMKDKLKQKRDEGRGGWEDPNQCSGDSLRAMLAEHVLKGDPVDVANLAMMLNARGEPTFKGPVA